MRIRPTRSGPAALALLFLCAGLAGAETAVAAKALEAQERLRRDVAFLASDACEGRGPTTQGLNKAADYIANQFKAAGLAPGAKGSYFQTFTLPANFQDGPAVLALSGPLGQQITLREGVDYYPFGLASGGSANAPVVFAGYGISAKPLNYDDYAGLDVKGKVVALLRGAPRPQTGRRDPLWQRASFAAKIQTAQEHGAAGVLIANEKGRTNEGDHLLPFDFTSVNVQPAKLPAFHLRRSVLRKMLASEALDLDTLERTIGHEMKPDSRPLAGWTARFEVKAHRGKLTLKNVIGVLEGIGPLAKETVVVGAHYDHLGYGGGRGSRSTLPGPAIHNGADDNASGTTAMMELARRFSQSKAPRRRMVFMAFSGEEMGLLGSKHYVKEPLFPLDATVAMLNLDMVGRMATDKDTGKGRLLVEGAGTGKPFTALVERLNKPYGFQLRISNRLPPNSDHYSFYTKQIPVLFFWTGTHPDYHRPSDDADKINVTAMSRIVDLSEEVARWMATEKERPEYVKVATVARRPSRGPRLGIVPGYGDEGKGLLVDGVSDGGPAKAAGIQEGDRIVKIGDKEVTNIGTYMQAMSGQKQGTTIEVSVLRKGETKTVKVKLER